MVCVVMNVKSKELEKMEPSVNAPPKKKTQELKGK